MDRLLIIEDSVMMQKIIMHIATTELSCEFDIASDLAEAKAFSSKNHYFLALADLHLPDAPNGEIVDHLAEKKIATIVLTASLDEQKRELVLQKGVIDYILKESRDSYFQAVKLANQMLLNRKMTVLLADDSKVLRSLIRKHLESMLFNVVEVINGAEALTAFNLNPNIDLLITDFNMSEMNGIELIRNIRQTHARDVFPIIGLSSSSDPTLSGQFLKHGANDFLATPFIHEEFQWRILKTMEQIQLIKKITDTANQDYLTKLYNRRFFFKTANNLHKNALTAHSPLVVAILDIDFFKKVNDDFGHDSGDAVLVQVASILKDNLKNLTVARYGGEEFIILIENFDENKCTLLLDALRKKVESTRFLIPDGEISVTISIGAATLQKETLEELISKADVALYKAKDTGRNKLVFS